MATREAESMRKSVGIIPAQHQSVLIANIYNDHRNQVVLPAVQSLLDKLCAIDITSPEDKPETANPMRTGTDAGEES
jgi:hypothetical protein